MNCLIVKNIPLFFVCSISIALFTCAQKPNSPPPVVGNTDTTSREILCTTDTFSLCWVAPVDVPNGAQISAYEIFYRVHGDSVSGWTPLRTGTQAVPQPPAEILRSEMRAGTFDFAIRTVFSNGEKSYFCISLDPTADNPKGWYLRW